MATGLYDGRASVDLFSAKFKDSGDSPNLLVDGSVTSVPFRVGPALDKSAYISRVVLVMAASSLSEDGFMSGPALNIGVELSVKEEVTDDKKLLTSGDPLIFKTNREILLISGVNANVESQFAGADEFFTAEIRFWNEGSQVVLEPNEFMELEVNDNLDLANNSYFEAAVFGALME